MTHLERQVATTQRRLWINRWLRQWGWTLVAAISVWTITWVVDRLFGFGLPMAWIAAGCLVASAVAATIWLARTREDSVTAAAALDSAAGLKARVATGLSVAASQDAFAQATVADAQRSVAGLSARKFIPLRWAGSLSISAAVLVVALLSLLLPKDLLKADADDAKDARANNRVKQVKLAVARPVEAVRKALENNPRLEIPPELKELEGEFGRQAGNDPDVLRREAIKKLDSLRDALKNQADADRFKALEETKKRLAKIGQEADPKNEVGKLIDALSRSDFQEAQKSIEKIREQLAKRMRDGKTDPAQAKAMQDKLNELSKKLQEAAQDKRSEQELKNAGLNAEEAKRVLEALAKKDPKQLAKLAKELAQRLKDKGVTEEQMKQMLEKMQQRQQACKQCDKMGQKMGQAAKQMEQGEMNAASEQLSEAGEMLNEMEQLDQALNDLESQMSQLEQARDDLGEEFEDDSCKACDGTGFRKDGAPCPKCNGTGNGPGQGGRGRAFGNRDRNDNVDVDFVNRKAKIKTKPGGSIIGQSFVKGSPLKGKSEIEFYDAVSAAELDATDALNRDRVPRRYRSGVKKYFERSKRRPATAAGDDKADKPTKSGTRADGKPEPGR